MVEVLDQGFGPDFFLEVGVGVGVQFFQGVGTVNDLGESAVQEVSVQVQVIPSGLLGQYCGAEGE